MALGTKKEAEQFADQLEKTALRAAQGTLTEARARAAVAEIVEYATGAPLVFHDVKTWLQVWLDGKETTKAKATFQSYRKAVMDFLAHIGADRAARGLELVTVRDFQSFRDRQVKEGKTPQTANFALKRLRIPFALARKQGLIPMNPAEAVERLATQRAARGTFDLVQLRALVAAAEGDWQGAILAGVYTGQRLRDVANLRWGAVDFEKRTVEFVQAKNKRHVLLPIHPRLEEWFSLQITKTDEKGFVFPKLAGKGTGGAHGLSGRFTAVMKKAGIDANETRARASVKNSKGRTVSALSFHSLRHTFNSIMANAGVAQELRQELTGHASAEMNRIYTHHDISRFRSAVENLPKV